MKLSIALAATSAYLYAWKSCVRRMATASRHREDVHVVYVSDGAKECAEAFQFLKKEVPKSWQVEHRRIELPKPGEKYKIESQILIAKLHGEMFSAAREAGADQCWTIEADVLVPPDSLRMMEWALAMPQADGAPFYDVAFCTYPNGLFIGGRGTPQHPIAEDFLPHERKLSDDLLKRFTDFKAEEKALLEKKQMPDEEYRKKAQELHDEIKKCPPDGTIWQVIAKHGWHPRGWVDFAYPAIGRGAIVPSDWCGQGCNLLSKKALALSTFEGYDGQGTQDLFLCWKRYHPAGIRLACITHSPCDHVKKQGDKIIHYQAGHEQVGESQGHLRVTQKEWIEI